MLLLMRPITDVFMSFDWIWYEQIGITIAMEIGFSYIFKIFVRI